MVLVNTGVGKSAGHLNNLVEYHNQKTFLVLVYLVLVMQLIQGFNQNS